MDSEPVANRVLTAALEEIGLRTSYEEVTRELVGLTMDSCVEVVERWLGRALPRGFVDRLRHRTFEAFRRELRAVRGVEQALDSLDVPYCVASSGEHEKMRLTLGLTGLLPRFDGRMFSATEVERGKPHPDLFLHVARRLDVPAEHCVVVEDSLPGVLAARAAGMRVLGYAERSDADELRRAGAVVFDDMARLPRLL